MIIPEIDFSPMVDENASSERQEMCLQEIHTALKDVGFLSIINHGVPLDLFSRMEEASKKFFYLPRESKTSISPRQYNPKSKNVYRGYFPASVFGKEGLDMSDLTMEVSVDPTSFLHEVNQFPPEFTAEQKQTFNEYYTALHKVAVAFMKCVWRIFGADIKMVDNIFKRPDLCATLRLNYYPQHQEGYAASEISAQDGQLLACETHADLVIMTFLYQDLIGGLQVQSPKDLSWHDVPCNREAIVVNTGQCLQKMTNDKYMATFHRVLLGTQERLSIPFFFEPVADFLMDSKILLPDEERKYPAKTYKDYINQALNDRKEYRRDYSNQVV